MAVVAISTLGRAVRLAVADDDCGQVRGCHQSLVRLGSDPGLGVPSDGPLSCQ